MRRTGLKMERAAMRNATLDYGRMIAAIGIVLFHCGGPGAMVEGGYGRHWKPAAVYRWPASAERNAASSRLTSCLC